VASILSPYFFGASLEASHFRASIRSLDRATAVLPAKLLSLACIVSDINGLGSHKVGLPLSRARVFVAKVLMLEHALPLKQPV
jgi:hypothetical protein